MKKLQMLFIIGLVVNNVWSQNQNCFKVNGTTKISSTTTGFTGTLVDGDYFGQNARNFGDFDGDGVEDLIVGAQLDDDGGTSLGAVYIILLKSDGSIKSKQKISATAGGFTGSLATHNYFGSAVSKLKDVDGDGVNDLLVGHIYDNTATSRSGAVWIIFLKADGTVKSQQKIANGVGGFPNILDAEDNFGCDAIEAGDLDGDGTTDILVGAPYDDDGGTDKGAVYIINLNTNGTVKSYKKISATTGGFSGTLASGDAFGYGVGGNADLNGDGKKDIVVGARATDDGGSDRGATWVLFLNSSEVVTGQSKISATSGSFSGTLDNGDHFGSGVAVIGDINGDGFPDIAVTAPYDDDGGTDRGAAWLIMMDNAGKAKTQIKISATSQYSLKNKLDDADLMGWRISALNDIDGDGQKEIVIGAMKDDDGGTDRGAVYIMNLQDTCNITGIKTQLITPNVDVKIFPNPACNLLNIECHNNFPFVSAVKIFNLIGEEVMTIDFTKNGDKQSTQTIDISSLKSGVYSIQISSGDLSFSDKIIINR